MLAKTLSAVQNLVVFLILHNKKTRRFSLKISAFGKIG
ncbi:Hypothetical protein AJF4211_000280 [Avibacterium paragallinarum JF4211]|nr:Hypothetical protein AJF4211_000280 [Avibacterium paragallinarum JF4211]